MAVDLTSRYKGTDTSSLQMGSMPDALLPEQYASALGATKDTRLANLEAGAQLGVGGRVLSMDGATPAVMNCCHIVVLQMPKMFDLTEEGRILGRTLRSLIELHSKNVSGIDFNYTANFSDTLIGHDTQNASMPTTVVRSGVSPTFEWDEAYGNVVWNSIYYWLLSLQHPDTQVSHLSSIYGEDIPPWVWSTFAMSFIAIQPDPTGIPGRIYDAAVYTQVIPTETGMIGFKRTPGTAEVPSRSVAFKGVVSHNDNTRELGKVVMATSQMHRPNYQRALTYSGDILTNTANYDAGIMKTAAEAIAYYTDNGYSLPNGYENAGYTGTSDNVANI